MTFKATVDASTDSLTHAWSFEGGTPATSTAKDPPPITFASAGLRSIHYTVRDENSNEASDEILIHVKSSCDSVVAKIISPTTRQKIEQGQSISFTGSVSGGEPPYTGTWVTSDIADHDGLTTIIQFNKVGVFEVRFHGFDSQQDGDYAGPIEVEVTPATSDVVPGLYDSPVVAPDGVDVLAIPGDWANQTVQSFLLAVAGSNSFLVQGPPWQSPPATPIFQSTGAQSYGGLLLSGGGSGKFKRDGTGEDAVFTYGPNGGVLSFYYPPAQDWNAFSLTVESSSNVIDGISYDNDRTSGGLLVVTSFRITEVEYQPGNGTWDLGDDFLNTDMGLGTSTLASALARGPDGSMLVATNGAPGSLFRFDRTSGMQADYIGPIGDGARQLRCAGNVCAISNYDSDDLTIATWDAATDSVKIVGQVPVNDGPVGIDLLPMNNGDVAILSTGFNDDHFNVLVVDSDGQTVAQWSTAADTECSAPAHAAWLHDPGNHIVISCNGSDKLQIVDSGL